MSAGGGFAYMKAREQQMIYRYIVERSWEHNYDIGLGMIEYPKIKHWRMIKKIIRKLTNKKQ